MTVDELAEDGVARIRSSSFNSKLRKGSTCNIVDDSMISPCPGTSSLFLFLLVERQIRYFIDFCPSLDPSLQVNVSFIRTS